MYSNSEPTKFSDFMEYGISLDGFAYGLYWPQYSTN